MNTKKIDEALSLAEQWATRVSAAEPGRTDVPSDYQFRFSKDEMFQLRGAFEQIAVLLTAAVGEENWNRFDRVPWRNNIRWKPTGAERRDLERRIVIYPGEQMDVPFDVVNATRLSTLYATPEQARGLLVSDFLVGPDRQLRPVGVKSDLAELCEASRIRPFSVPSLMPGLRVQLTIENPTDTQRELLIRFDGDEMIR